MACISCPVSVLNGASANSEGGRLARMTKAYCYKGAASTIPDAPYCKVSQPPGQVITPPESIRVSAICYVQTSRLTQEYVKKLLAAKASQGNNYLTENTRVLALQERIEACNPIDPLVSRIEPINTTCLPIPPPPGPPARCVLTKNQKF